MLRRVASVCVLALVIASCGGSAAPSPARSPAGSPALNASEAVGHTATTLAEGPLAVIPTLPLYINVLDVPQAPAASTQHAHLAGFVYAVGGVHRLVVGSENKDSQPGQAVFVAQDVVHSHTNPGTTPNQWYFISLRNVNARIAPPTFPGQTTLYESPDLPANAVVAGTKYFERLNSVTVDKAGRGPAHKHGGPELLLALEGTTQLRVAGQQPQTLTKGKGAVIPPNTVHQFTNTGDAQAKLIVFVVAPEGVEFVTFVDTAP
jgi:quercetin dioxygenase-like cupin family protein